MHTLGAVLTKMVNGKQEVARLLEVTTGISSYKVKGAKLRNRSLYKFI
jgi:hypothetical protein